jgi:hypothetical protein
LLFILQANQLSWLLWLSPTFHSQIITCKLKQRANEHFTENSKENN